MEDYLEGLEVWNDDYRKNGSRQSTEHDCSDVCRIWYLQCLGQYWKLTVESSSWGAKELGSLTLRILENDHINNSRR